MGDDLTEAGGRVEYSVFEVPQGDKVIEIYTSFDENGINFLKFTTLLDDVFTIGEEKFRMNA